MAVEFATSTRHHKISKKISEMCVSQIQLITEMSRHIKWLSKDKNAFYKYEKKTKKPANWSKFGTK